MPGQINLKRLLASCIGRKRREVRTARAPSLLKLQYDVLEDRALLSATANLLADINPATDAFRINAAPPVAVGETAYFAANDGIHGQELWKTDGTPGGTHLVVDLAPGPADSLPRELLAFNGALYFLAQSSIASRFRLWRSDGSAAGTFDVTAPEFSSVYGIAATSRALFIAGSNQSSQSILWSLDLAGHQFAVTAPGLQAHFDPFQTQSSAAVDDVLYFAASDSSSSRELWRSDGTSIGTWKVAEIHPGSDGSYPHGFITAGDAVYFTADDGVHGSELWRSDGTEAGTSMVIDLWPGPYGSFLSSCVYMNGELYFSSTTGPNADYLWTTDGTTAGVHLIAHVGDVNGAVAANNRLFLLTGSVSIGREIWVSDGSREGTQRLIGMNPGAANSSSLNPWIASVGNDVYFTASNVISGEELWRSDGTTAGTTQVADIWPGTRGSQIATMAPIGSRLLFTAESPSRGRELWASDGTNAGTLLVKDINTTQTASSSVRFAGQLEEWQYFIADDGVHGDELWRTDGKTTQWITDIAPGELDSIYDLSGWPNVNGQLLFAATDGVAGGFYAVGPDATVRVVKPDLAPSELVVAAGIAYFRGYTRARGFELWRSDGTGEGTYPIADGPTPAPFPDQLTVVGNNVYFVSRGQVWRTDGTSDGTQMIFDPTPGPSVTGIRFAAASDRLYFIANDGVHGYELWTTTGSPDSTRLIRDINPGSTNSAAFGPWAPFAVGNRIVFPVDTPETGIEAWVSDGTEVGTHLLKELTPGPQGTTLLNFALLGGELYFTAQVFANTQLWKSDLTAEGTQAVRSLGDYAFAQDIAVVDDALYIATTLVTVGKSNGELWRSVGTTQSTIKLAEYPYTNSGRPVLLANVGSTLLINSTSLAIGDETWTIPLPRATNVVATSVGHSTPSTVQLRDASTGLPVIEFPAYDPAFVGGVRVAMADVNGDSRPDIVTGAGPGGGPHVRVFDGVTGEPLPGPLGSFFAFDSSFSGGVYVAAGDLDNDGLADVIVAADAGGGPHVRVFSGRDGSLLSEFFAYDIGFSGGVRVAVADTDADGQLEIITAAGAEGGPHVRVLDRWGNSKGDFFAYSPSFTGGVFVAAADLDADGRAEIITGAGSGGGPHVRVFRSSDLTVRSEWFAYSINFSGGVRVATTDQDGDGLPDIVTAPGAGGGPHVRIFQGRTLAILDEYFAFDPQYTEGLFIGGGETQPAAALLAPVPPTPGIDDDVLADIVRAAAFESGGMSSAANSPRQSMTPGVLAVHEIG